MSAGEITFAFLKPSSFILLLLLAGLVLLPVRRRAAVAALALGAAAFAVLSVLPVGAAAIRVLEARFPAADLTRPPDTIVLLGGYLQALPEGATQAAGLGSAADRLTAAAALAVRFPAARLAVAGNPVGPSGASSADLSAALLTAFGIARERLVLDGGSRSTWDNAVRMRARVRPQPGERHLLVTSAFHMPRAVGAFRAAGWPDPLAFPVDHLPRQRPLRAGGIDPALGLRTADRAAREWLALLVYRLTGRTAALLPAP